MLCSCYKSRIQNGTSLPHRDQLIICRTAINHYIGRQQALGWKLVFADAVILHHIFALLILRMTKLLPLCALLLCFGCAKETAVFTPIDQADPIDRTDINQRLYEALEKQGTYNWAQADDELLWSAGMQSDSIFALGYQPAGFTNIESQMHRIDLNSAQWQAPLNALLQDILTGEQALDPTLTRTDLLPMGPPRGTPSLSVRITNAETIQRLRTRAEVRYLEPMGYELPPIGGQVSVRSSSGCGGAVPNYNLNPADYQNIAPNVKQSWHHATSNVSGAWSNSTGSGVTVAVIDSGTSFSQENLGSAFNSGYSQGRSVERVSTFYTGWWWWRSLTSPDDDCGHGTQMAGLATAPRGADGNAVGIAYGANLLGIKAVEDVVISSSDEKEGVKDALILAANRGDVKVISMSLGTPFYSGTVADGVYYAYNQGKLMLVAAGTSLSWTSWYPVTFPANMSQCTAVTGVRDSYPLQKCNVCHDGSEVEFVVMMQRAGNSDRTALSLAEYSNQPQYISGSSAATASMAGIAALVYATNPGASRGAVLNALRVNGSNYPNKDSDLGWGVVNAQGAVTSPL